MFEKIEKLNEGVWNNETLWKCLANENKKFGVCDCKDNIILPFIFDEIEMSKDKKVVGKINGKLYYFVPNFKNHKTKLEITGVFLVDSKGQVIEDEEVCYVNRIGTPTPNLWMPSHWGLFAIVCRFCRSDSVSNKIAGMRTNSIKAFFLDIF